MADDANTSGPDSSPGGPGDGAFSQDEIDAAFGEGGSAGEGSAEETASPAPSEPPSDGAVGQDDIDALMQAAGNEVADGELTQADIDAALAGDPAEAGPGDGGGALDDAGGLTQADIDAALAGASGGADEEAADAEPAVAEARLDMSGRPFDAAADAMAAAIAEEKATAAAARPPPPPTSQLDLPDFGEVASEKGTSSQIDLLHDVNLRVKIELGRSRMMVEDVLQLGDGSVIELDRLAGDPVDVYANDRLVARGEVLVLNDNFCVRVSEIISAEAAMVEA